MKAERFCGRLPNSTGEVVRSFPSLDLTSVAAVERLAAHCALLLTRDKDFDEEHLKKHITPAFGIVLLAIPQQPGPAYAEAFSRVWPADFKSLLGRVSFRYPKWLGGNSLPRSLAADLRT